MAGWWWTTFHWVNMRIYSKLSSKIHVEVRIWRKRSRKGKRQWKLAEEYLCGSVRRSTITPVERAVLVLSQQLVHYALVQFFSLGKCSEQSRTVPDPQTLCFHSAVVPGVLALTWSTGNAVRIQKTVLKGIISSWLIESFACYEGSVHYFKQYYSFSNV